MKKFINRIFLEFLQKILIEKDNKFVPTSHEVNYLIGLHNLYLKNINVPGHIIEVGAGNGRNSIIFGNLIKYYNKNTYQKYYGFDSFNGYTIEVLRKNPHFKKNKHVYDYENTLSRIISENLSNICYLIRGDIKDTIHDFVSSNEYKFNKGSLKISILYIDCNDYDTALLAMNLLKPYFSDGTIIAIDENKTGGETRALQEFCTNNNLKFYSSHFGGVISYFTIKN